MASGGMPKYQAMQWPTVLALRELGGSGSISEIDGVVPRIMGLTEEQQSVLHGDGPTTEVGYRISWARSFLKGMGLADNTGRGIWALTPAGQTVTEAEIEPLRRASREKAQAKRKRNTDRQDPDHTDEHEPSDEDWRGHLLEVLLSLDPYAFERLCQRLLREAGFSRTQVTKGSGDEGIDGLGTYRLSLVSFQVFFQAKRWRKPVGSQAVRDFRGAMTGRGEKGLLITTSTFTAEAKAEASRDGAPPVDLVDGLMLCDLLAQYSLGVTTVTRTVTDYHIDDAALRAI